MEKSMALCRRVKSWRGGAGYEIFWPIVARVLLKQKQANGTDHDGLQACPVLGTTWYVFSQASSLRRVGPERKRYDLKQQTPLFMVLTLRSFRPGSAWC